MLKREESLANVDAAWREKTAQLEMVDPDMELDLERNALLLLVDPVALRYRSLHSMKATSLVAGSDGSRQSKQESWGFGLVLEWGLVLD